MLSVKDQSIAPKFFVYDKSIAPQFFVLDKSVVFVYFMKSVTHTIFMEVIALEQDHFLVMR